MIPAPTASTARAVSCTEAPVRIVTGSGVTNSADGVWGTETGTGTKSRPLKTSISAWPAGPTEVTTPSVDTVATAVLVLTNVTGECGTGSPAASSSTPDSWPVPFCAMVNAAGVTASRLAVGVTATATSLDSRPALAVTVAKPAGPTERTAPAVLTVTISVSLDSKVTGVPASSLPWSSRPVAESRTPCP